MSSSVPAAASNTAFPSSGGPLVSAATAVPSPPQFGRLEAVSLRNYWPDEARDFTPWLAREENLTLLGETIGLTLEFVAMEQAVGPFRADIIARDEEVEVIIENQLDATDHRHLGQLMVYAANRGARVIVWIARQVTDEYRKVIDWLNEKTDVSFFALEVELWRIGDSPVAPKFNIVCEPNEFERAVRSAGGGEVSDTAQLQLEFFTGLVQAMDTRDTSFNPPRVGPRHWANLRFRTSRAHIGLSALRNGRLGVELYIPGGAQATAIYDRLEAERASIEAELDLDRQQLDWMPLPDKKASRIILTKDIGTLDDRDRWSECYAWMLDWAEKFKSVFSDRIKNMDLPDLAEGDVETASTTGSPPAAPAGLPESRT